MLFPMTAPYATKRNEVTSAWYGPATATFPSQFSGDPYDPSENDVHVRFVGKGGIFENRLAFFNAEIGSWQAILVSHRRGTFEAQLYRNGKRVPGKDKEGPIKLMVPLPHGFVRPDPRHDNRFAWDDGVGFTPIGFDLAWQNQGIIPLPDQIAKMGAAGVNWTRIWACDWDGKNPWWPNDHTKLEGRALWPPAFQKWDRIVEACSAAHVRMQFVLFHHGEFSSQVDPNWPDNPWNAKNGGFLQKPGDFFTDPEAKIRAKIWLRYAVARYAASPAIFGWELFNEVQWVDPIHIYHRWDEVEAWHKEMADYIRSIDPYGHSVTTSSELRPKLNASLDYLQPHVYPNNILASVMGTTFPKGKPGFYGEFGPGNMAGANLHKAILDGMLGGLLANHAGGGMFWYWDKVEQQNLYDAFTVGREVVDLSHWQSHPGATIANLKVQTASTSDFTFQPGLGWGQTTQSKFDLPEGATPSALGHVSNFLQGAGHRELMPDPIQLNFTLRKPEAMTVDVGPISDGGGNLAVTVDGVEAYHSTYRKGDAVKPIVLQLPAGTHEVKLANDGPDWIQLDRLVVGGIAPAANAEALADADWMLARITKAKSDSSPMRVDLTEIPLAPGSYHVTEIDLDSGKTNKTEAHVAGGGVSLIVSSPDDILIFSK
jgi:hypothetical protein